MTYPAVSILGRNNKLDSDEDVGGVDCLYPRSASSRSLEDVHDDGLNLIRAHVPKASHWCGRHTDGAGGRHFFYLRFLRLNIAERTGRALDKLVIVHKAVLLRECGCRAHDSPSWGSPSWGGASASCGHDDTLRQQTPDAERGHPHHGV